MKHTVLLGAMAAALAVAPNTGLAQGDRKVMHAAVVNAPVEQVWNAFTTKAGLESWMAPHAEIELGIGGTLKTRYDAAGTVDDANAVTNTILSYEPGRMLSFKVSRAPRDFPFPHAILNMWTVVYFEPQGKHATRVTSTSMGFGADDESTKMFEFFRQGNARTLGQLQKRFASAKGAK